MHHSLSTLSVEKESPPKKKASKEARIFSCDDCGLLNHCQSPKFNYVGNGAKKILFVVTIPSKEADIHGELNKGDHYEFLQAALDAIGISLHNDCWYTTVVNCRPLGGKDPTQNNIKCCASRLQRVINRLDPSIIIPLGDIPFKSLIGYKMRGRMLGIAWTAFVGDVIPDQDMKRFIAPLSDIGYLVSRKKYPDGGWSKPLYEREPGTFLIWRNNLEKAVIHTRTFYSSNYTSECIHTMDVEEAIGWVTEALKWEYLAFDYETTGLKPHREGHKIWTASISDGLFSYSFPFFDDANFRRAWKRLMLSDVKKIGHNLQFENIWTHALLGYYVENWCADTMLMAHNIHNLKPTGLKYLTYSLFGNMGYDDSVAKFLEASPEEEKIYGDNAFNTIHLAPMDDLLTYNALDSLYTYKIWEILQNKTLPFQEEGNAFFLESAITLSKTSENGVCTNAEIIKANKAVIEKKMEEIETHIYSSEEVAKWDLEEPFNHASTKQLGHLLFDILGVKPLAFTEKGATKVDKESLELYDVPVIKDILEWRAQAKIIDYLDTYLREAVDGVVHPGFKIHSVDTFRSGCASPNIQNIPKRNKEVKKIIRDGLVPRKGNRIIEYDYKSLEVMISACNNLDPTLIKYVTDPSTDMHYDSAAECFLLPRNEVPKEVRQDTKSSFVFAEFYGSYYEQVAVDLWEDAIKNNLIEHLKSKGIKNYADFKEHIKEVEESFWGDRFPVYAKWRKDQYKFYCTHGYVDLFTGFRAQGPMSRNNTFNTPVQGPAYHVLQWTMNKVQKKVEKECERSFIIAEIHDALVVDAHPSEEALIDEWVKYYGTMRVREAFPWIIVPLIIEKERSEIDGTWSTMSVHHEW